MDVKVREVEAKVFLALRAAKRGYKAVIGQKSGFANISRLFPPGYYMAFGATENAAPEYEQLSRLGHKLVLMDEEGLVCFSKDIYLRTRFAPQCIEPAVLFACWGNNQREMLAEAAGSASAKLAVTGNPRLDVLRPEFSTWHKKQASRIVAQHGRYILFNSNFGSCNHFLGGDKYFESLKTKRIIQTSADEKFYRRYFDYRGLVMREIADVLPRVARSFQDHKIVVRPHPSENHAFWAQLSGDSGQITTIMDGSVVSWILGADCVIHNFCTTAIEAFALGKDPISYEPVMDTSLQTSLPSSVSVSVRTADELISAINAQLENPEAYSAMRPAKKAHLENYARNISGPYAADAILDALASLEAPGVRLLRREPIARVAQRLRRRAKQAYRYVRGEPAAGYIQHKFQPFTLSEITNLIKNMETYEGEYSSIKVDPIDQNIYMVS